MIIKFTTIKNIFWIKMGVWYEFAQVCFIAWNCCFGELCDPWASCLERYSCIFVTLFQYCIFHLLTVCSVFVCYPQTFVQWLFQLDTCTSIQRGSKHTTIFFFFKSEDTCNYLKYISIKLFYALWCMINSICCMVGNL